MKYYQNPAENAKKNFISVPFIRHAGGGPF
jgi:hypothetical protein